MRTAFSPNGLPIGTYGLNGCLNNYLSTSYADTAWPASNRAIFVPIRIVEPTVAINIGVGNGVTVSGNFDVGIFTLDGVRIISSGSTAQSGAYAFQVVDIADTLLGSGVYYLAVAFDNTTATPIRTTLAQLAMCKMIGIAEMSSAFPLPATATLATATSSYIPWLAIGTSSGGV